MFEAKITISWWKVIVLSVVLLAGPAAVVSTIQEQTGRLKSVEQAVILLGQNYAADAKIERLHGEIRPASATATLWEVAE